MSKGPCSQELCQNTPIAAALSDATVMCFNCYKTGHYALSCPEPKKADLKEIEEDPSGESLFKESGKEEP
jgi:hypothetical protein